MHDVIGVARWEAGGADVVVDERERKEAEEAADLSDPVDQGLWRSVLVGRGGREMKVKKDRKTVFLKTKVNKR